MADKHSNTAPMLIVNLSHAMFQIINPCFHQSVFKFTMQTLVCFRSLVDDPSFHQSVTKLAQESTPYFNQFKPLGEDNVENAESSGTESEPAAKQNKSAVDVQKPSKATANTVTMVMSLNYSIAAGIQLMAYN